MTNAIIGIKEWNKAQESKTLEKKKRGTRPPSLVPRGVTQIFVDASWSQGRKVAGLCWYIQTHNSLLLHNSRVEEHVKTPLIAEALALASAIQQASEMGLQRVCVKSDSQVLIEAINKGTSLFEIYGILLDICMLASSFDAITFEKIDRELNVKADTIAKQALRSFVAETEL